MLRYVHSDPKGGTFRARKQETRKPNITNVQPARCPGIQPAEDGAASLC